MKKGRGEGRGGVLTSVDDGLHCELVAALLDAAVKRGDVLLLPECVGVRKHRLDLSHVALLKAPAGGRRVEGMRLHGVTYPLLW